MAVLGLHAGLVWGLVQALDTPAARLSPPSSAPPRAALLWVVAQTNGPPPLPVAAAAVVPQLPPAAAPQAPSALPDRPAAPASPEPTAAVPLADLADPREARPDQADERVVSPLPTAPDRPALPVTGLTLERLEGLAFSGAGLQLRLQISALGVVESVEVLRVQPGDEAFAQALAQLLRDTPHVPARRDGRDVASVKTVWFGRGPLPEPERAYPVAR